MYNSFGYHQKDDRQNFKICFKERDNRQSNRRILFHFRIYIWHIAKFVNFQIFQPYFSFSYVAVGKS